MEESENDLQKRLDESKKRAQEAEEMMRQAAQYGKTLLEKNMELEASVDEFTQEKYELNLRIQTMQGMEKNLNGEVEYLRESVKLWELKEEDKQTEEMERWARREETWKARVAELESALVGLETKEKGLVEQLELAERQCQEAGEAINNSVGGSTLSEEIVELQQQAMELLQEKHGFEQQLARTRAELESSKAEVQNCSAKSDLLSNEIDELRCEVTRYIRAAETSKIEVIELEAQLEAVQVGEIDENSKGNSLFSEVNDRREKVEDQMKRFADKYNMLKENYDSKVSQLQKTKMHNAQLLSIAGTMGDTSHTARLEQLLSAEREKNKELSGRLDSLEKMIISPSQVMISLPCSGKADDSSEGGLHTTSEEYSYLASLLENEQKRCQGLQTQLQLQLRQNLEDSDKLREITRKVNLSESNLQRAKADNYALKVALDDMKTNKDDHKPVKKEPKKIVEVLKFDSVQDKSDKLPEKDVFVLKEIIANNGRASDSKLDKLPELENMSPTEKEKVSKTESGKPRKRAMFSDTVSVHDSETGDSETAKLQEENTELVGGKSKGGKTSKPKGKRQFGAQNTVRVTGEEPGECKQQ